MVNIMGSYESHNLLRCDRPNSTKRKRGVKVKKVIRKIIITCMMLITLQATVLLTGVHARDLTHIVQKGDTLYRIGQKYGASVRGIRAKNNLTSNIIYPGNRLIIPHAVTAAERDLLARLVQAEAVGEPYAGKVAVAVVVLNRVDSTLFPNTITQVIKQPGQFTPVTNGAIKKPASQESIRAVNEALTLRGTGNGSLYFYNPNKTSNKWLRSKQVTVKIGNHLFAK